MNYYAHSANKEGKQESVVEHLSEVGSLCRQYMAAFSFESWGEVLGHFHDFGMMSQMFQKVLDNKSERVNHAIPGAVMAYSCYCSPKSGASETAAEILAMVIACHHGELRWQDYRALSKKIMSGTGTRLDRDNRTISLFGREEFTEALSVWKKHFSLRMISPEPDFFASEDRHLSKMLFVRFVFSALIDADWNATAEHFSPGCLDASQVSALDPEDVLQRLADVRKEKQQSAAAPSLNKLRDDLSDVCLAAASQQAPGLFTLTAPDGLGKSLSLLAFAARHCMEYGKRRIIFVLPYFSALEQTAGEYRQIIPDLAVIDNRARLGKGNAAQADRWDAPCVVTDAASFFDPLFSSRSGDCRHLHQLANSVIILDEAAQLLPEHLLDASLRTVKELCEHYGCTVLLSSAAQPSYQYRPGLSWNPREIVPDPASLFAAAKRARWDWRVDKPVSWEQVAQETAALHQCCVIVNTKAHGQKLLDLLRKNVPEDALFYLSADLCAAHRSDVMAEIQRRLETGMRCFLVATQRTETGMGLDFPVVYRALAPLEDIIQAAGWCNRNGCAPYGEMTVFLPENDSGQLYPTEEFARAAMCTRTLLDRHGNDIDCDDLTFIDEYYQLLYSYVVGDRKKLRDAIEMEDYPETARQYRMTDASVRVIVPYEGRKDTYDAIRERLDHDGLTRELLQEAREIMVSTCDIVNVKHCCVPLHERGKSVPEWKEPDFYLLEPSDCYDEMGLHFNED